MGLGDTILANAVSGLIVAFVVAIIGVIIARWYTERREAAQARRERDLAAAAELYRVYGQFFATLKVWNAHLGGTRTSSKTQVTPLVFPDAARRSELLGAAAAAEGGFEALLIRITLEHDVGRDQRAALWCLRTAYKQLRRAIRRGEPLLWWRSDIHGNGLGHDGYRAYQAFKMLTSLVADEMLSGPGTPALPAIESRLEALRQVTGPGHEFTDDERIKSAIRREQALRCGSPDPLSDQPPVQQGSPDLMQDPVLNQPPMQEGSPDLAQGPWEWFVVAEQLLTLRPWEVPGSARTTMFRRLAARGTKRKMRSAA
ncbi:MAG TPA: hypothetical protein VG364_08985 [Candidatus Dormibacteraeota bacterium]|jgi:hypothetical protein|nr:hypothetical protein [Candidatus Dormibacteraeota bacterium]